MDTFITNKNALIWAFNENIGKDTTFEGHTNEDSIVETIKIINYLISNKCFDANITKEIITNYKDILDNVTSTIPSSVTKDTEYVLYGWKGHAILLFWEKVDDNYNFGLINCGQGSEFQGYNSVLCNGLIIFKNITKERINNFLTTYTNYYDNTKTQDKFSENKMYAIFYFILFDELLDIKEKVKFEELDKSVVEYHKLDAQLIGSCAFTNLINLIYYIYYKKQIGLKTLDICLEDYALWYNNAKVLIKNKIFDDILISNNTSYYNIYKYILDTTDKTTNLEYEELMKSIPIENNDNIYDPPNDMIHIGTICRDNINIFDGDKNKSLLSDAFWDLYENNNLNKLIELSNNQYLTKQTKLIEYLFLFFSKCKLFDNDLQCMIPLFIIYKLKQEEQLIIDTDEFREMFLEYFNIGSKKMTRGYLTNEYYIYCMYLSIYLIIIKEDIPEKKRYYKKTDKVKKEKNISYYNYFLFSNIPIINHYYKNIVNDIINDLNDNIEIFPDITNEEFATGNSYYYNIVFTGENAYGENTTFASYFKLGTGLTSDKKTTITKKYDDINFLLWYIFINNVDDTINDKKYIGSYDEKIFSYETYGYYNKEIYDKKKDENFIINTDKSFIEGYPGGFKLYEQKKKLFQKNIQELLIKLSPPSFEILKQYIIYFYLCELSGDKIEKSIFNFYDLHIFTYFDELWDNFESIIYTYVLKYNKNYSVSYKKSFEINDSCLINSSEKNNFIQPSYQYTLINDESAIYYHSVIDFYVINYNYNYKLVLYKDNKNTSDSINIVKSLLPKYNNIYLLLNFYFCKEGLTVIGIHKNNKDIRIEYIDIENINYYEYNQKYKIIKLYQLPEVYQNFYKLISNNDKNIFLYKNDTQYFLRTFNYDFIFKMENNQIYYSFSNIDYIVNYCNDSDLYYNYGILKLEPVIADKKPISYNKLLCIYNYNHILNIKANHKEMEFINKSKKEELNKIDSDFKKYYYKIINEYNGKYILSNADEVLALLINCLNYNSPYLILKNIEQIKVILRNNDNGTTNKYLKHVFQRFNNIYTIPISLLLYNDKILNQYYYDYANKLYSKYSILLRLNYDDNRLKSFNYTQLTSNFLFDVKAKDLFYFKKPYEMFNVNNTGTDYFNYIFYKNVPYNENRNLNVLDEIYFGGSSLRKMSHQKSISFPYYNSNVLNKISYDTSENSNFYKKNILDNPIFVIFKTGNLNYNSSCLLEIKYNSYDLQEYCIPFNRLLKVFIPDNKFNEYGFEQNMVKASELYTYLINERKDKIYPIQELLMGSGKTSTLTPYICILLLNHFLSAPIKNYNNQIYIVMPDFLINSSFEILMKYLLPLFNNIEILMYPNKLNYKNSFCIYLISDTNYKLMFLRNDVDTTNKYMIYDEVDMLANPLTCELNIPTTEKHLETINDLYFLSNLIYNQIFINKEFWDKIKNKESNKIHNYIYNLDSTTIEIINLAYDNLIKTNFSASKQVVLKNLIEYVKENVLFFIVTKQFNFDYGMPENYTNESQYNYKFKAIPYSAVDSPVMGSEFSDPILTYILTLFCYKIVNGNYRKIDKNYIITYYENICKKNKSDSVNKLILFNFFSQTPKSINEYLLNSVHYKNTCNDVFDLPEKDFEIIIIKILNINNSYFAECQNISFNDLLLYKNVKNFICFTGTAYIKPPVGEDINFDEHDYITFSKIQHHNNVLEAVKSIVWDEDILKNFYTNKSDMLIEDIFNCINNYDLLIDIGGIFIKYTITSFIEEYKKLPKHKDFIVYFDNGRKIYNLKTNQFVNNDSIKDNNAFYYFSNKNITGVDAKDIMYNKAHGLVTITNKTNFRDFSQGIFRMRDISNGQTFDVIFNEKFRELIMVGGCDNFNKIIDSTQKTSIFEGKSTFILEHTIRANIIKSLEKQQKLIDSEKEKILIKQNIFALNKRKTNKDNKQILYIDPQSKIYNAYIAEFKKYMKKYKILNKFTIETLNIILKNENSIGKIKALIDKYFRFNIDILETKQNMVKEEAKEENIKKAEVTVTEVNQIISIPIDSKTPSSGIIYANLTCNKIEANQILVTYIIDDTSIISKINKFDTILIYDNIKNNLAIVNIEHFNNFLIYNDITSDRYTFISIYNNLHYGKKIKSELINYFIQKFLSLLSRCNFTEQKAIDIIQYLNVNIKNPSPTEIPLHVNFYRNSNKPDQKYNIHDIESNKEETDVIYEIPSKPETKINDKKLRNDIIHEIPSKPEIKINDKKLLKRERNAIQKQQKLNMKVQQKIRKHGGNKIDYEKYMKYKQKYLQLLEMVNKL